jgi:hypothetical protein
MRPVKVAAVALTAVLGLALASCSSSSETTTPDAAMSPSPSSSTSASPDGSMSGAPAGLDDFAEVDGFTLVDLSASMRQAYQGLIKNTPQLEGFEGRLVEKDGEQIGIVMRIAVDADAASSQAFEDNFLPGFANGIAGTTVKPNIEEINGVKVIKVDTPGGSGTAYAWLEDAIATVLVFKSADDAQAYAEGALG